MNIYTIAMITFLAIIVTAGGYLFYKKNNPGGVRHYASAEYGVSFDYPAEYELAEMPLDSATGTRIMITEKKFTLPENGEGPTAITIDVFDNPTVRAVQGTTKAEAWIASSAHSNWSVSDMEAPGPTRVADKLAWLYTWDGLYRGISVVTDYNDDIFLFSVTYDGEGDIEKREAFTRLMESVRFGEAGNATSTDGL